MLLHADALDAAVLDDLLRAHRDDGADLVGLESALQDPAYAMHQDAPGDGDHTFSYRSRGPGELTFPSSKRERRQVIGGLCR